LEGLFVEAVVDGTRKVAEGAAPIALAAAAMEVAAAVVNVGVHLVLAAVAPHGDGEAKIAHSAAQPKGAPQASKKLAALTGLEQNISRIELNHHKSSHWVGPAIKDVKAKDMPTAREIIPLPVRDPKPNHRQLDEWRGSR
jgi:hypothetical protein